MRRTSLSLIFFSLFLSLSCFGAKSTPKDNLLKTLGEKRLYVNPGLSDSQLSQCPFAFRTLQEAVRHLVPGTSEADRMTILLAPAVHWIDDPDDPAMRTGTNGRPPIALTIDCPWLQLVGLSENAEDVVIAANRGQTQGAVGNFTMLSFHGDGVHLENLTLGNYCNVDLVYPRDPSQNRPRRADAITQAQLAFADGDFLTADNCRFISRLNTCPLNGGRRTIFTHCYFECTDDALEGRALYRQCNFQFFSSKPFYATSRAGAMIIDSDITLLGARAGNEGGEKQYRQYLTKASSPVFLASCRFHADGPVALSWTPYPALSQVCYERDLTLNGSPVSFARTDEAHTVQLPDNPWKEIVKYLATAPEDQLFAYLDLLPIHATLLPPNQTIVGDTTLHFRSQFLALGDRPLSTVDGPMATISNPTDTLQITPITQNYTQGLRATAIVNAQPTPLPPPAVLSLPVILKNAGILHLDYKLQLDGREDQSLITWSRCSDIQGTDALPVAVSRLGHPETTYQLQPGDVGHYIIASLQPCHVRSQPNKTLNTIYHKKIEESDILTPFVLETDFHDFPVTPQPLIAPGTWTLDGYKPADTHAQLWQPRADSWFYGSGIDGHRGTGLLQKEKGARMLYTPTATQQQYGKNMSVTLTMDPGKTAGQGFGSATDQYLDIYILYDTQTHSGYGLRIIRTTKHANAVDMMLMRYEKEKAEPLTDPVSTTCFLTNCTVRLWTANGQLHTHVSTTTPQRTSELAREVNLKVPLSPDVLSSPTNKGFGLQHTGSVGASAIMLHQLRAEWY